MTACPQCAGTETGSHHVQLSIGHDWHDQWCRECGHEWRDEELVLDTCPQCDPSVSELDGPYSCRACGYTND